MATKHVRRGEIQWTRGELWVRRCVVGFVFVLAVLAIWFSYAEDSDRGVLAAGSDVRLALTGLKAGKLRLVNYAIDPSTTSPIAVRRGEDDVLRVAFASCRSCSKFRHYKWFGKLVCGHCKHAIKLPNPGEKPAEKAGCTSVAIPYLVEGDKLVVRGQDIMEEFHLWYVPGAAKK